MKLSCRVAGVVLLLVGCDSSPPAPGVTPPGVDSPRTTTSAGSNPLVEARRAFTTKLKPPVDQPKEPFDQPPAGVFGLIEYPSPVGNLGAYLTPDPGDGAKHPAIVWMTGGDCNTIGDVWTAKPGSNDQTAAAYRKAGIVMMFPALRGGNTNPGRREGFLGEVDDVIAAADYLAKQPYVDPKRVYLGGHSTGGTLVLLVAESSDRFRAVFSFGPAEDAGGYDPSDHPYRMDDPKEVAIRSPGKWLAATASPTFVFEGLDHGNVDSLRAMEQANASPLLHFYGIAGVSHFSILGPINALIARKIVADTGPTLNIGFKDEELAAALHE